MYIVAAEITLRHIADEGDCKLEMLSDGIDHDTAKNFRNRRCHNDTASILSQTRTRTSARTTTTALPVSMEKPYGDGEAMWSNASQPTSARPEAVAV